MKRLIVGRSRAPFILSTILWLGIFFGAGCGGRSPVEVSAVVPAPASQVLVQVEPTSLPPSTRPLPAVSVYTLDESGAEAAYPADEQAAGGYPPAAAGLPAPITVVESQPPPAPTAAPTMVLPTLTPAPAADDPPPATSQPTFTPPALPQTADDDHYWLRRPIPEGGVVWTDKFYPYGSTRGRTLRTHHGVEFNVTYDTPVLAAADGVVVHAGPDSDPAALVGPEIDFYGIVVVIQHDFTTNGRPIFTVYGHLNSVTVAVGQRVRGQEQIGFSGATGVADGPHLHFEVRVGENSYQATRNPLLWLWPFPERGTIAGRVVFPGGQEAYEAPVQFRRIDGGESSVVTTTTYADEGVNGDDLWDENFAFDDVPAGYYEVYVKDGETKYAQEVWVYPRRTAFVEIVIGTGE